MDAERGRALLCSWCWDTRGWPQRPSSQQCLQHTVLKSYRPAPTQADCPTFKQTSPKMSRYTDASVGGLKQEDLTLPGCVPAGSEHLGASPLCLCPKAWSSISFLPWPDRRTDEVWLPAVVGRQQGRGAPRAAWDAPGPLPAASRPRPHLLLAPLHPIPSAVTAHLPRGLRSPA